MLRPRDHIFGNGMYDMPQSLQSVTVTGGTIHPYAFSYLSLVVVLGDGVERVKSNAFMYYYGSITVSDTLIYIEPYAFMSHYTITVYTNAVNWPAGWDADWLEEALVVWGCDLSFDGYVVSFTVGNSLAPWGEDWRDWEMSEPRRAGFVFGGWASSAENASNKIVAYQMNDLWNVADGTLLFAVWIEV